MRDYVKNYIQVWNQAFSDLQDVNLEEVDRYFAAAQASMDNELDAGFITEDEYLVIEQELGF